ncbi:MAG: DUF4839 domain-containing protein [Oscillospiraceae bacterium]|nr:DUF4839 domain-containing protein [Oscillospiraceae bacterium]
MKKAISVIFIILVLITMLCGCSSKRQYEWPKTELAQILPLPNLSIDYLYDSSDSISARFESVSIDDYQRYVSECKNRGFCIEAEELADSYDAFNETGYHLELYLFPDKDMTLNLDAPKDMADFTWPDTLAGRLVPQPKSKFGRIEWEYEDSFVIYVGHMTKEDFSEYANTCKDAGFSVDYRSGDTYFYADNPDGYSLSLNYKGFSTIFIRLDRPDDNVEGSSESFSENTEEDDTLSTETETAIETQPVSEPATEADPTETEAPSSLETEGVKPDDDIITIENNEDFANLVSLTSVNPDLQTAFVGKYKGRIIEFDCCILFLEPNPQYDTIYSYVIIPGTYTTENASADSIGATLFILENASMFDFKWDRKTRPSYLTVGSNIRMRAKIISGDDDLYIYLDPVCTWGR